MAPAEKKFQILLVDDEPNVTAGLKRAFARDSYEIFCADSAKMGLEILAQHDIDVVVSDEQMPGIPGTEFLAEVRKAYPDTIRMILTGQASMEAAIRAINEGEVYRFFTKPLSFLFIHLNVQAAILV